MKTIYNRANSYNYLIEQDYSDGVLEIDVDIVTADGTPLTSQQQSEIKRWLFAQTDYRKLYGYEMDVSSTGDEMTYVTKLKLVDGKPVIEYYKNTYTGELVITDAYLNCVFVKPEKIEGNGGIIGYKTTIVCDSPAAWQNETISSNTLGLEAGGSTTLSIDVTNELPTYIYPEVHIIVGNEGGDITIVNNSDDATRLTTFKNLEASLDIQMDSSLNFISGDSYSKMTDKNFIRLVNGRNNFTLLGNIDLIEFTYNNRILI